MRRNRPRSRARSRGGADNVAAKVLRAVRPGVAQPFLSDRALPDGEELVFKALFTIEADGAFEVEMALSTGYAVFDALAMDAARRWEFAPATCGGVPVKSYLRLRIEFVPTIL